MFFFLSPISMYEKVLWYTAYKQTVTATDCKYTGLSREMLRCKER